MIFLFQQSTSCIFPPILSYSSLSKLSDQNGLYKGSLVWLIVQTSDITDATTEACLVRLFKNSSRSPKKEKSKRMSHVGSQVPQSSL